MTAFGGIDSVGMSGKVLFLPQFLRWRLQDAGNDPGKLERAAEERDGLLGNLGRLRNNVQEMER